MITYVVCDAKCSPESRADIGEYGEHRGSDGEGQSTKDFKAIYPDNVCQVPTAL